MIYWDSTYSLVIIAMLLSLFASFGVKSTFAKYQKMKTARGITGAEAARRVLDMNGLQHIRIERVSGELTDHFDPRSNVIRLSDSTYNDTSVAAVGVAAHEAGHAVQHATGYVPIKVRNAIVPVVNIGSQLAMPLFVIGLLLNFLNLAYAGVILFSLALVFQLVTLPVELNASSRAIKILDSSMLLYEDEIKPAKKVLKAAAMTYVAAVAATALQLLRLLLILNRRRDD
jgi:hypothetical protein